MKDILDCYPGIGTYKYMLSSQQVCNIVQGFFPTLLWSTFATCLSVYLPACLPACLPAYLPLSAFVALSDNIGRKLNSYIYLIL